MIGTIIITHGKVAETLMEAAQAITGRLDGARALSVKSSDATDAVRESLASAIKEVDGGQGVIIFTDMFGGTPTNIALSFMREGRIEVITGVNLPMLIKFAGYRADKTLQELTLLLKEYGRSSIVLAGDMLKEKK